MDEKESSLSTEQLKEKIIELLKTNAIKFISYENDIFKVNVLTYESIEKEITANISEGKVASLKIDDESIYKKCYLAAAKIFIQKYLDKLAISKINLNSEEFESLFLKQVENADPKTILNYEKINNTIVPYFKLKEKDAENAISYMYSYLKTNRSNYEAYNVEFIFRFMHKANVDKDIFVSIGTLMGQSVLDKSYIPGNAYSMRSILKGSQYSQIIVSNLLDYANKNKNSDVNTLFNECLDLCVLNEELLVRFIKLKGVSSFYVSKACLYAIDNNFLVAMKLFADEKILCLLESTCQNALALSLIKFDKDLAKITLRKILESRPRYETYKIYSSLLNEEEKENEKPFFEAVAKEGSFLGAYHLEVGKMLTENEFNELTPTQANDLISSLSLSNQNSFAELIKDRINKALTKKIMPNDIGEWLILLFHLDKKSYYDFEKNSRINKEIINLPNYRRSFILALDKENLLEENGLYRYL